MATKAKEYAKAGALIGAVLGVIGIGLAIAFPPAAGVSIAALIVGGIVDVGLTAAIGGIVGHFIRTKPQPASVDAAPPSAKLGRNAEKSRAPELAPEQDTGPAGTRFRDNAESERMAKSNPQASRT